MVNRSIAAFLFVLSGCSSPDTQITKLTPDLVIAPETITFGSVVKDLEIERQVQLINGGRATLAISDVYLEEGSSGFTMTGDTAGLLQPEEALPLTLHFLPLEIDSFSGTLVVESNDEENPELKVEITGEGIIGPQPDIVLSHTEIDFEEVPSGETETEYLLVQNAGDGPLNILETVQTGAGAFAVVTDPAGQVVAPGSEAIVLIDYTPDGTATGHNGTFTILSDDPDEPEVAVELIGGDGGPDTDYPVAVISGDAEVAPPAVVALDGTDSTDPADVDDEHDLEYAWTLTDRPTQSHASLDQPTAVNPSLDIDIAGTYEVSLVVTDFNGTASAPAKHTIIARPVEELYIAVSWDKTDADVDLHMVPNGASFWGPEDACFCHTEPDWGEAGVVRHTGDDDDGLGPESVFITEVIDSAYHIGVHYFEDNGGATVEATVTIYLNGELHEVVSNVLIHNYFWRVGYVQIEDGIGAFVPHDDVPHFSETRECTEVGS